MILALLSLTALADSAPVSVQYERCPRGGGDVVICGSRGAQSPYRLPRLPEKYDAKRVRAETNVIAGVQARAYVDSVTMPDGNRSNRLMVTLSTAF